MVMKPATHKFVAVLNKKIPVGNVMNALGHMTAGLASLYPNPAEMRFDDYMDANDSIHPSLSDNPFIVLQADNSSKIRALRQAAIEQGIRYTDFANTMVLGTYVEQRQRTKKTPEAELEYYGIVMFGEIKLLNDLTRKFSLWRSN